MATTLEPDFLQYADWEGLRAGMREQFIEAGRNMAKENVNAIFKILRGAITPDLEGASHTVASSSLQCLEKLLHDQQEECLFICIAEYY